MSWAGIGGAGWCPIRRALLAPSGQGLALTEDGKYQSVVVPAVCGYQMVVFEEASDA